MPLFFTFLLHSPKQKSQNFWLGHTSNMFIWPFLIPRPLGVCPSQKNRCQTQAFLFVNWPLSGHRDLIVTYICRKEFVKRSINIEHKWIESRLFKRSKCSSMPKNKIWTSQNFWNIYCASIYLAQTFFQPINFLSCFIQCRKIQTKEMQKNSMESFLIVS